MARSVKPFTTRTIRALVIRNPAITVDELSQAAEAAGYPMKRATVSLARSQALDAIEVMKQTGHWKD